jgi:hypothetical protein
VAAWVMWRPPMPAVLLPLINRATFLLPLVKVI